MFCQVFAHGYKSDGINYRDIADGDKTICLASQLLCLCLLVGCTRVLDKLTREMICYTLIATIYGSAVVIVSGSKWQSHCKQASKRTPLKRHEETEK